MKTMEKKSTRMETSLEYLRSEEYINKLTLEFIKNHNNKIRNPKKKGNENRLSE